MPQLDFSWWLIHLLINWTLWATIFTCLSLWNNANYLQSVKKNEE